ncbi:MAG: cadmium-translocating P-type ATPase [Hyphomicrobiales bacterium]|nr:cadmium-translocating P-type ATPase [Hyphomicrobiales bacterium]
MDGLVDLSGFVRPREDGLNELDFAVEGMTCAACIVDIEQALKKMTGVRQARVNYTNHRLAIAYDGAALDPAEAVETLRRIGYRVHPFEVAQAEERDKEEARYLLRCLAVAGFAAMNVMLLSVSVWSGDAGDMASETRDLFHWISALIALPAAAFAGRPFFVSAFAALKRRALNMDVPISLGVILALAMSVYETIHHARHAYYDSALMLLFFLLCGRYLEQTMRRRTRAVAGNLAALRSPLANLLSADGAVTQVATARLKPGALVLVRPGDRVPVDGTVVKGTSEIDESIVTGETRYRRIGPGAEVLAGTLNFSGALHVSVRAAGVGSFIDEIERLLESAAGAKSRFVGIADRASRIYAPVVHITALATAIGWMSAGASAHDAIVTAIAVLIITCPCALALAVPAVHVVSSGALFQSGVLLNGDHALERLAEVDVVVFDKTGTLTTPEPRVANAEEIPAAIFERAARLARASKHPLARALVDMRGLGLVADGAREEPGAGVLAMLDGVEARLGSAVFCGLDADGVRARAEAQQASAICYRRGDETAIFLLRQTLRLDAAQVVTALRDAGYAVEILSGDSAVATADVARALGVEAAQGDARPSDKLARLEALRAAGRKPLMVGDGFNDAPALKAAYASISPITGADVAQACADALFLGERLQPVADALAIARKSRRLMRENLFMAVAYNMIAVPLAVTGYVTPLIAALAMSGSSLLVTVNALRAARGGILGLMGDEQAAESGAPAITTTPQSHTKDVAA